MPPGVIGLEAVGRVIDEDYQDVLVPAVSAALERGDVRLLYVLGDEFDSYTAGARLGRHHDVCRSPQGMGKARCRLGCRRG